MCLDGGEKGTWRQLTDTATPIKWVRRSLRMLSESLRVASPTTASPETLNTGIFRFDHVNIVPSIDEIHAFGGFLYSDHKMVKEVLS